MMVARRRQRLGDSSWTIVLCDPTTWIVQREAGRWNRSVDPLGGGTAATQSWGCREGRLATDLARGWEAIFT